MHTTSSVLHPFQTTWRGSHSRYFQEPLVPPHVSFYPQDFDAHIENLRAQLQFLNATLEGTDHNAPDWLATDLLSLRNKSGRLHDDMKRFRGQIESEGLAEKKVRLILLHSDRHDCSRMQVKFSNKRLSIEAGKATQNESKSHTPSSNKHAVTVSPASQSPTPMGNPSQPTDAYVVQHVDVTEEVNRRLHESRLRRLMEAPSTAQKRKYNAYEEPRLENAARTEYEQGEEHGLSGNEHERTPTKRLKSSGILDQPGKRKGSGYEGTYDTQHSADKANFKRRKL